MSAPEPLRIGNLVVLEHTRQRLLITPEERTMLEELLKPRAKRPRYRDHSDAENQLMWQLHRRRLLHVVRWRRSRKSGVWMHVYFGVTELGQLALRLDDLRPSCGVR